MLRIFTNTRYVAVILPVKMLKVTKDPVRMGQTIRHSVLPPNAPAGGGSTVQYLPSPGLGINPGFFPSFYSLSSILCPHGPKMAATVPVIPGRPDNIQPRRRGWTGKKTACQILLTRIWSQAQAVAARVFRAKPGRKNTVHGCIFLGQFSD